MRRKVESIKPFGPNISFKTLIKKILCILHAALVLTAYGCGPKKVDASSAPADDQKSVTQMVNNKKVEAISDDVNHDTNNNTNNTASATTTPEVTPVDASFITPEVSATPIQSNYFLFSPTEEEKKALEMEAKEYFERLKQNYCDDDKYKDGTGNILDFIKNSCGCFDNIDFASCATDKELQNAKTQAFDNMENILNTFIVITSEGGMKIAKGDSKNVSYNNPKTAEIFNTIKRGNYSGVLALDALEKVSENIHSSYKKGDSKKLLEHTAELLTLLDMIFKNNGGNYSGIEITAFKDMYPTVKFITIKEAAAILYLLVSAYQIYEININSPLGYSISDYAAITVSPETMKQIKQEIFTLMMDAYFAKVKNGEIVIQENNEVEEKPNVPIYTPAP